MIASDAPSCDITYNHHSDDSIGVIYTLREHFKVQVLFMSITIWQSKYFYSAGHRAKFSTLSVGVLVYAMQFRS